MTLPVPTPSNSLDSQLLVDQWYQILDPQKISERGAPVLRSTLGTLVDWVLEGLEQAPELENSHWEQVAAAGERLVELGINDVERLSQSQAALASWLSGTVSPEALRILMDSFSRGAHRAFHDRNHNHGPAGARDESARYQGLAIRFAGEIAPLREAPEQIAARALALLQEEIAAAAGYFELQEQQWQLQQGVGELPTVSFIQPLEGKTPPLLEDGQPIHLSVTGQHQLAIPVPVSEERRGLLFLTVPGFLGDPAPLLEALCTMGRTLGTTLELAYLRAKLSGSPSAEGAVGHWGGNTRKLGLLVDEDNSTQKLEQPPLNGHPTAPNQRLLPLRLRGEAIGQLLLEEQEAETWGADEAELVNVVAEQMAQALEAARLFQESQRRAAQLAAAAQVSRAASSLLSLEELMNAAVDQIRRAFNYYHVQVFLLDEERKWAVLRSSTGEVGQKLLARKHRLAVGSRSVIGQVTATATPIVVRETGEDTVHFFNELLPETKAELAVPLIVGDRVIGALDVQSRSTDVFYEEDIAVLQTLADQMAVAIQNALAYEQQRETADQLREIDKLKTQFLANMSHELRTPLNSIIGFSRVILKGIDGPITDLQKKDLTTIYNSGQMLLQLIDAILDISKIEAGKMELEFEDVNLKQLVDVVLSTAVGLVKDKPIELVKEVPEELPPIRADLLRLRQVMLNLLSNAAKFTEEGEIRVSVTQIGEEVQISVSDSGLGIPPEKHEKLFEAFYQVDGSATRRVGGTGLGLAITKSFIEMHGGQISVESTGIPGEGTTFHVTLPIAGPATPEERIMEAPLVLAVDSERGITMLYEKYLGPEGYRFEACHNIEQAFEEAVRLQPQLILLDMRAGDTNGFVLLKELRKHILTRDIPVIICTIEEISKIEEQGLQAGASDFLQKPVLRQDLVSAVQRWTGTQTSVGAK